jgi:hypothetical protein
MTSTFVRSAMLTGPSASNFDGCHWRRHCSIDSNHAEENLHRLSIRDQPRWRRPPFNILARLEGWRPARGASNYTIRRWCTASTDVGDRMGLSLQELGRLIA